MRGGGPLAQQFGLTVNPQNVLHIRAVVLQEAHQLRDMLREESRYVMMPELGGDPVSKDMSREFNEVTHGLLEQANDHVDSLFALCDELVATARDYGHTEDEIKASFAPTTVSQIPLALRQATGMSDSATRPVPTSLGELLGDPK